MLLTPEARKQVNGARIALHGVSKTSSLVGKYTQSVHKFIQHIRKWDDSGQRKRSARGGEGARSSIVSDCGTRLPLSSSACLKQLPSATTTLSPEDWTLYVIGSVRGKARAEAPEGGAGARSLH